MEHWKHLQTAKFPSRRASGSFTKFLFTFRSIMKREIVSSRDRVTRVFWPIWAVSGLLIRCHSTSTQLGEREKEIRAQHKRRHFTPNCLQLCTMYPSSSPRCKLVSEQGADDNRRAERCALCNFMTNVKLKLISLRWSRPSRSGAGKVASNESSNTS